MNSLKTHFKCLPAHCDGFYSDSSLKAQEGLACVKKDVKRGGKELNCRAGHGHARPAGLLSVFGGDHKPAPVLPRKVD